MDRCVRCDFKRPSYNSCRNRHCPTCQALRQARWVEQRMDRVLPTQHFHVVFTVPAQLHPIARANPAWMYKALFDAARITLVTLGKQRLGTTDAAPVLGVTAVLHTWTKELHLHPHLHCVVTAGGFDRDSGRWFPSKSRFLFPVALMRDLFRSTLLRHLKAAVAAGDVQLVGRAASLAAPGAFDRLVNALYRIKWVVYAKKPFAGSTQVFKYLGRYTHRVAVADSSLLSVTPTQVEIRTRGDGRARMTPAQFIQRFLLHMLPQGFHKIRHFGLYSLAYAKHRDAIMQKLPTSRHTHTPAAVAQNHVDDWQSLLLRVTGVDIRQCPHCAGPMERIGVPRSRGPPGGA